MGMDLGQLARFVVKPVIAELGMYSRSGMQLMIGTVAHESLGGRSIDQVTGLDDVTLGPGFGPYQMERRTHDDLFRNYLGFHQIARMKVMGYRARSPEDPVEQMAANFWYATAVARCQYYRFPEALPAEDDIEALARYWKTYWNTDSGKGTIAQWVLHYNDLAKPHDI